VKLLEALFAIVLIGFGVLLLLKGVVGLVKWRTTPEPIVSTVLPGKNAEWALWIPPERWEVIGEDWEP